ncbi:MAG: GTPase ObgE [Campylobacteraceae bacterium]|jgi:GTP-binding protein|nr:GTPase ObgE [Campylobacteraceae bacterium]
MFIDSVELTISSGKGGAGSTSFRREKHVTQGGPDGGDGGNGGNVIFKVDRNSHTLSRFRGINTLKANNGENGLKKRMHGKKGEDLIICVPPGTQVIDVDTDEILLDLVDEEQETTLLEGGLGGLGNWHFRSSTNQQPRYAQPGREGKSLHIRLELKLIADVGLVGFPNTGKSTLISVISNAKPEIANYEFTTLTPKLGVIKVDEFKSFVMADIPGIIEGASEGKGLGLDFLKHIERTKFLLFMLDITNVRTLEKQFSLLKNELSKFSQSLSVRKFAIAITKIDALDVKDTNEKIDSFFKSLNVEKNIQNGYKIDGDISVLLGDFYDIKENEPHFILPISSATNQNIKTLIYALNNSIEMVNDEK